MNKFESFLKAHVALAVIAAVGIFLFAAAMIFIGASNRYNALVVRADAVQLDNTNRLDNMRKKVREVAGVSQQEVAALERIIVGNSEARGQNTAGGGQMVTVSAVREAVPSITEIKTLNRLVDIIAATRTDWQNSQTALIEVKRQGDHMMSQFPDSLVLGILGKQPIKIVVVTSAETKENFRTGEDNESWVPAPTSNSIEK